MKNVGGDWHVICIYGVGGNYIW